MSIFRNTPRASGPSYRPGDLVRVRSLSEILATLDVNGCLEGLPFMPEMAGFCGRVLRVHRQARRTCVEGNAIRRMDNTLLLEESRCDGAEHQGCQRKCLIFWKDAWLEPAVEGSQIAGEPSEAQRAALAQLPTYRDGRFYCQSTELVEATSPIAAENIRYYLHDFWVGETTLRRLAYVVWFLCINKLWQALFRRDYYSRLTGKETKTRNPPLNLVPGEWVEVKSAAEIQATLDEEGRNRGLRFEAEMAAYCGRRFRVAAPVNTIIDEKTGKMLELTNTVALEGGTCQGICASNCPRANYFYWREVWLRRVTLPNEGVPAALPVLAECGACAGGDPNCVV